MTERIFTNGRQSYIVEESPSQPDHHAVWFVSSMGSERWPRPALSASQLDQQVAQWGAAGYAEKQKADRPREPQALDLTDKQFAWLSREVTEWRRRKFDARGEMAEPGEYVFNVEFEFRFGFTFAAWEKTLHARGQDLHPPIRPQFNDEAIAAFWSRYEDGNGSK